MRMRWCLPAAIGALQLLATCAAAQVPALPGDRGRPLNGVMPLPGAPGSVQGRPPPGAHAAPGTHATAASLPLAMALRAAAAIDQACGQYPLGVAVVDAAGVARLIYVPDRSEAWHGYSAVRKAYTAVTFQADTSSLVARAHADAAMAARIRSDPNLQVFPGGLLLRGLHDEVLGAVAVSGAEPGGHDEECAVHGRAAIQEALH